MTSSKSLSKKKDVRNTQHSRKISNRKSSKKMSHKKMSHKKMSHKKMSQKKMSQKKMSHKKMSQKKFDNKFGKPKTNYVKHVQEPWFSLIQNGVKLVEGRPNKGDFAKFKKYDVVQWTNSINGKTRQCYTTVTDIKHYKTFQELLQKEGLHKVLPSPGTGIKNVDDGVKIYRQWYSPEVETEFGVIAIHLRVIRPNKFDSPYKLHKGNPNKFKKAKQVKQVNKVNQVKQVNKVNKIDV
jgi:ASC-1-like (ASCH) protein